MSQPVAAKVSRASRLPIVWLVPLVALAIGGWLIFRELHSRGTEITIAFTTASGVEAGRTNLVHQGVPVGEVTDVSVKKDLSGALVKLRLHKSADAFARADAEFWIVRPEVTFSGVRGLETLIGGVQLNGRPGSGPPAKEFIGLDHAPVRDDPIHGRAFLLRADKLGSLSAGAPVYYREVKVGVVEMSRLADDATEALIRIRISTPYIDLVRDNTVFWNAGGAAFNINLLGAKLKSTSLEALFSGGVAFATPEGKDGLASVATDGASFTLHDEAEKDWLKWRPRIPIKPLDSEPVRQPRASDLPAALKPN